MLWKLVFNEWYIIIDKDTYIHAAIVKRFCKCRFNFIYTFSWICPGVRRFGLFDYSTGGGVAKATGRGHVEIDE